MPNTGKSTLLNSFYGEKLAIVTDKPQTTRNKIIGIKTTHNAQVIFLDTPGLYKSDKPLNKRMMREAEEGIKGADVIVFLCTPDRRKVNDYVRWVEKLKRHLKPMILAINKVDLVKKEELLPLIDRLSETGIETIVPVSALTGDGVDSLEREIVRLLPEGPPLYNEDTFTEHTERFLVSEVIREKLFHFTSQEIPYSSMVAIEEFKERNENLSAVSALIYVEKDSQKKIVIGRGGEMIKRIGRAARTELEDRFGRRFYLDLKVKTKKDWTKNKKFLKDLGTELK